MNLKKNFILAKKVMKLIKNETISLHDIIPSVNMPEFKNFMLVEYEKKFGTGRVSNYLNHMRVLEKVRNFTSFLINNQFKNICAPSSTGKLAITMCGVGECDETSQRAIIELVIAGCTESINLVVLRGKSLILNPNPANDNHYYNHAFVIIGKLSENLPISVDTFFSKLSDKHIFLDPSLKILCVGSKAMYKITDVVNIYGFNKVVYNLEMRPGDTGQFLFCENMLKMSQILSNIVKDKLNLKGFNNNIFSSKFFTEKSEYNDIEKHTSILIDDTYLTWEHVIKRNQRY